MKKLILIVLACALLVGCGGGSMSTTAPGNPKSQQLDPQGNWLFTFTGSTNPNQGNLIAGGQLYELNPPAVTSNGVGAFLPNQLPGVSGSSCFGQYSISGQVSGESTITMTLAPTNTSKDSALGATLTGTIAADQKHMSGTWTATQTAICMGANTGGPWNAELLAPVTGNWSGTVSNGKGDLLVTASLTENVDQTSLNMGQVTGTFTVSGSPCFPNAVTFNLPSSFTDPNGVGAHGNLQLTVLTLANNGVQINLVGFVAADGTKINLEFPGPGLIVRGGACDGQSFNGDLSRQ